MSIKGFQIDGAVQRYDYTALDNKPIADATLSVNGGFADAAAVGNAIATIRNGGSGLSDEAKQALLVLLEKVAYVDENGQTYYAALETALYPPTNLVSISAVYTQSGTVYDTDSLDDLKADLVVAARYDDGSVVTVSNYSLSGTLTVGTSTITVGYGGKTTTFNVIVTEAFLYSATNLIFDGTNNIDTGVSLFSAENIDKDFLITINISDHDSSQTGQPTIIGAQRESSPYPGICVRLWDRNTTKYQIQGGSNSNSYYDISEVLNKNFYFKRESGVYTTWIEGGTPLQLCTKASAGMSTTFDDTLLLGSARNSNNEFFRYWVGTIASIKIKWI